MLGVGSVSSRGYDQAEPAVPAEFGTFGHEQLLPQADADEELACLRAISQGLDLIAAAQSVHGIAECTDAG